MDIIRKPGNFSQSHNSIYKKIECEGVLGIRKFTENLLIKFMIWKLNPTSKKKLLKI